MDEEQQLEDEQIIDDSVEDDAEDEQQEDDEKPFEGEYDPERARRTITRLRDEVKNLKKQKTPSEDDPKRDALETENLQLRVALELGIPEKFATRLRGATREELIDDAHDLMETIAPRKETPESKQPRPRLKGGSQPDKEPELSAKDIVAAARRR